MLKGMGYLIFGIGLILMISKFYKLYKKEKKHGKYASTDWYCIIMYIKCIFRNFRIYNY